MSEPPFEATAVPETYDEIAPDGSEIRHLLTVEGASLVHCTLPPGAVSRAHEHRTVEELWYVLSGAGQVWRRQGDREAVTDLVPDTAVSIPTGAGFQFRAVGAAPLEFVIATVPPWPGAAEAVRVADHWEPTAAEGRADSDERPAHPDETGPE